MNKTEKIALFTAGMIAILSAAGCSATKSYQNAIVSPASAETQKPENKIFEPGQHCYWKFYNPRTFGGGQVSLPKGYEILDVEETGYIYSGSFMVWFINTETVEAEAVFESTINGDKWTYSKAGKVVKKEKTNKK